MWDQRIRTGIAELDAMLNGGFLSETANLVDGAPGTGKSTLGLQFIYEGIAQFDQPGLILAFDHIADHYCQTASNLGWDLGALENSGKLCLVVGDPGQLMAELCDGNGALQRGIQEIGARRVLVDSISHLQALAPDPSDLRRLMVHLVNGLKLEGVTSILTRESEQLFGPGPQVDEELAFLVDSYVLLRYVEIDSSIHRALLVLKLRGSDHAKDIREFEITGSGIQVKARFEGHEGILSGSPRRMADSFVKAFVRKQ